MPCTPDTLHQLDPKLIKFTKRVRTQLTKMHQSLPKLLEPSQTKLTKMKQSDPKLTKINEIDQDSENLVCRNEVK